MQTLAAELGLKFICSQASRASYENSGSVPLETGSTGIQDDYDGTIVDVIALSRCRHLIHRTSSVAGLAIAMSKTIQEVIQIDLGMGTHN